MPERSPRAACLRALTIWERGGVFADEVLHEQLETLSAIDRAFLTEVFYGILRNLSQLDFLIRELREAGPLDSNVRNVLRLGLYQIFHMRVPPHAAVNETVNLARRARSLVNAILRRSLREHDALERRLAQAPRAIRYSHPELLLARWDHQFGELNTDALCRWNNTPAEVYVRVNGLKTTREHLLGQVPDAEPFAGHPVVIKVRQIPPGWIAAGLCYVQDPSTLLACDLLNPQPGERVLDACAAPGGKTTYMAQLMENQGTLVASDSSVPRLARLRENLQRLGITQAETLLQDWSRGSGCMEKESFDRILIDAPCSNTGVIRRRVDVRWRLSPEDFSKMPQRQFEILKNLAPLLRPGGSLVYSTCSLEQEENQAVVQRVQREIPDLEFIEHRQSQPFRDGIDGAFAALFVRR